jgi:hypothetical protein
MQALAASCEELRARTENPPLEGTEFISGQVSRLRRVSALVDGNRSSIWLPCQPVRSDLNSAIIYIGKLSG